MRRDIQQERDSLQQLEELLSEAYERATGNAIDDNLSPEEAISDIINYYENVINCMPGTVFWLNKNSVPVGCNQNELDVFGFKSIEEFRGKTFQQLCKIAGWPPEAGEKFERDTRHVFETGQSKLHEEEPPVKVGNKLVSFMTDRVPLYDKNNNIVGVVGISIDISELKHTRDALTAKMKAETETRTAVMTLAGSIVHDLRTPLATLSLMQKNLSAVLPKIANMYAIAEQAGLAAPDGLSTEKLAQLVASLDDMAKIHLEMGAYINDSLKGLNSILNQDLKAEDLVRCESWKCLSAATRAYAYQTPEDKELLHWDRSCHFQFMGNVALFYRIISNLLDNAFYQIHKNQKGEIYIFCEAQAEHNLIHIKDTAGGVSPEILGHIFDGYYTTKPGGTGVGLAFCKLTMKSFGGDIVADSVEGESIEFVLSFPKILVKD